MAESVQQGFETLSDDLLAIIFGYLGYRGRITFSELDRRCHAIANDPKCWIPERKRLGLKPEDLKNKNFKKILCMSPPVLAGIEGGHAAITARSQLNRASEARCSFTVHKGKPYFVNRVSNHVAVYDAQQQTVCARVSAALNGRYVTDASLLSVKGALKLITASPKNGAKAQAGQIQLWDLSQGTPKKVSLSKLYPNWRNKELGLEVRYGPESEQFALRQQSGPLLVSPPKRSRGMVMLAQEQKLWRLYERGHQVQCIAPKSSGLIGRTDGANIQGDKRGFSTFTANGRGYVVLSRADGSLEIYGPDAPQKPLCTYDCQSRFGKPYFLRCCEVGSQRFLLVAAPVLSTGEWAIRAYRDPLADQPETEPICQVGQTKGPHDPLRDPPAWLNGKPPSYNSSSDACLFALAGKLYLATLTEDRVRNRIDWYLFPSGEHLGTKNLGQCWPRTSQSCRLEACEKDGLPYLVAFTNKHAVTIEFKKGLSDAFGDDGSESESSASSISSHPRSLSDLSDVSSSDEDDEMSSASADSLSSDSSIKHASSANELGDSTSVSLSRSGSSSTAVPTSLAPSLSHKGGTVKVQNPSSKEPLSGGGKGNHRQFPSLLLVAGLVGLATVGIFGRYLQKPYR